jgi:hypothetical protein
VLAGVTAAAVFLFLNPHVLIDLNLYVRDFGATLRHYASRGASRQSSHWTLPLHAIQTLLSESFHGPVIGVLSLLGLVGVAITVILRPRGEDPDAKNRRLGRAMALAYVVGYVFLYSVATTYPSPHNWLVLTPFTSLCAAWGIAWNWRWLATRWPVLARPWVTTAVAAPAVLLVAFSGQRIAYHHALPMTWGVAQRHLIGSLQPMKGRLAYYERGLWQWRLVLKARDGKAFAIAAPRLDQIPPGVLDQADAELFSEDCLVRAGGDFYRRRLAAVAPGDVVRIRPALFRRWGPSLVVLVHPWRQVGRPMDLDIPSQKRKWPRQKTVLLPSLAPQELGSLEFSLPEGWKGKGLHSVSLGGKPLALARFKGTLRQVVVTTRFDALEAKAPLRVRLERPDFAGDEEIRARLYRWQR